MGREGRPERLPGALTECGHAQAARRARSGRQRRGAARVGDQGDPVAGRGRLVGEQEGDVEQLLETAGADHAGLGEQ
ncbi:hypothetical protein [Streptomyces sp. A30]|uniref:hypothetical protein n=1 Tax=Streptomyces sp. A30 TaxID=2789273 RepID=UPI0039810BFF